MGRLVRDIEAGRGIRVDAHGAQFLPHQAVPQADGAGTVGGAVHGGGPIGPVRRAQALDAAAALMRGDEVFRDAAHHFLRQYDRTLTRAAPGMDDAALDAAIRTRSGKSSVLAVVAARLTREGLREGRADPTPAVTGLDADDALPPVPAPSRKPAPARAPVAAPDLQFEDVLNSYERPPLNLLTAPSASDQQTVSEEVLTENARMLEAVLDDYGVKGQITAVHPGPVVTLYELEPAPGLKASRVIGLSDDIARSMSALSARVSTVPGRTVIGIELPNQRREKVVLREILSARAFGDTSMPLPLALGKDIGGGPVVANLAKMPHLLIAGTTGSGKSVAINTMILSLLYKLTPEECRLIMIDPKMLELSVYDGIPHLLSPVVTDPKKAVVALKWTVREMEERYKKMSKIGVRNIDGFNSRVQQALDKGEILTRTVQTGFEQVRSVAAHLVGDHEAAGRSELVLPDTGVCGGSGDFDDNAGSCCAAPSTIQIGARPVTVS